MQRSMILIAAVCVAAAAVAPAFAVEPDVFASLDDAGLSYRYLSWSSSAFDHDPPQGIHELWLRPHRGQGRKRFEIGLPISIRRDQYVGDDREKTRIYVGNLYVGMYDRNDRGDFSRLGVSLPTAGGEDDGGYIYAAMADYGRFERYLPDVLTIHGETGMLREGRGGVVSRMKVGVDGLFPRVDGDWQDLEIKLHGALSLGMPGDEAGVLVTLRGAWWVGGNAWLGFDEPFVEVVPELATSALGPRLAFFGAIPLNGPLIPDDGVRLGLRCDVPGSR